MTSRERVLATFKHEEPDRVPTWCGASVEFWAKAKRELGLEDEPLRVRFRDDFRRVRAPYAGPNLGTAFDIARVGVGYGQPTSHPLADATSEQVHAYNWPRAEDVDISTQREQAEPYVGKYAILGGDWSPFWHDVIDLLGMENMYLKMHDDPTLVDAVFQHVVDYYVASNGRILEVAGDLIDIIFIGNDLGMMTGPLLSPAMFERFVGPHLGRIINLCHDRNLPCMMHCCGSFRALLPQLIELGLDAIHTLQPCCAGMDLRELKTDFGDKIVFNGGIDSHHVLIEGTPKSVREDTRQVLEIMMPGGGFICGASHDTILEETPVANVVAMFDAIDEFGWY